ncbi:MAG: amino acid adenylation domain-containing protein [Cyanobacteria bacterium]|jgi:amino acid adenylation domain-containing protein|nr:amino acid adenylation domain-containing protein [Cyanobacteria bacterium GSL.Bin1]
MTQSEIAQRIASLPPEKQKQLLQRLQQQKQTADTIPQQPRSEKNAFPLSFSQQRLWFLHQLERNNAFYNVPGAVQIDGELDITLLKQCFEQIISRHEVLRTHFELQGGEPRQVINPHSELTIPITDLQSLAETEQEKEVQRHIAEAASQPFDLSQAPLMRVSLLRLTPQRHILLFILHHIVSDAWSRGVMLEELTTLYNRLRGNQGTELPELPVQYADFAVWQREQEAKFDHQLQYWQQQLSPLPPPLDLPCDYPRPEVQTFRGGQVKLTLPKQLTQQLQTLSQQENATLFMALLAGWQILLSRYTEQTDIAVGSPIANRDHSAIEKLIGFFTNTLVFRTDLSQHPSFREVLQRVRETALGAYSHQEIPFEKLVEALQPERDLSCPPLFQVLFAFHDLPVLPNLPDLDLTLLDADSGTAKFDLSLLMRLDPEEGLVGMLEYNSDLFAEATIVRMANHLQTLLQQLVTHPEQPITGLSFLTPAEEQQFAHWNQTTVNYPETCVHDCFTEQAAKTPNQIALIAGEQQLTYQSLNQSANQLAHYLQQQGIQPHDAVGISLARNPFLPIAVLAVLKAGAAYVPFDPNYPEDRLAFMLEDSQAKVVLTQSDISEQLPQAVSQLELDTQWDAIAKQSQENPNLTINPDALAYIIYTSGSKGKPKGVAMPHRSLNNLIHWQRDQSSLGLKTLQFASLSFDVSFQECFATWGSGGTLVMVSDSQRRDPDQLLAIIQEQAIERLFLPFVALSQLAESAQRQGFVPTSLKEVITAGEQLQITPAIRSFFENLPHCQLINQYGPSETHVVTAYPLPKSPETWSPLPPIGRPVGNVQVYLLDENQNRVPLGVTGELYIGGIAPANGYLNRPELTAERFITNPFDHTSRLYKTGDLARYLPDGNLQYLGRKDNQVKVRGFRIELGEIEAILAQHSAITEVAVTVKSNDSGTSRLFAYIVPKTDVTNEELKQFLSQKLFNYSIPSGFVVLDSLPLTPSGKVDRRSLPEPQLERPELATTFTPPSSSLEQQIADIWQYLLQVDKVGIHDNFFDLGGHSLLIVQVRSRLEVLLNREIPLVTLFQYPTIQALVTYLNQQSPHPSHLQATANRAQKRSQLMGQQRQRRRGLPSNRSSP